MEAVRSQDLLFMALGQGTHFVECLYLEHLGHITGRELVLNNRKQWEQEAGG